MDDLLARVDVIEARIALRRSPTTNDHSNDDDHASANNRRGNDPWQPGYGGGGRPGPNSPPDEPTPGATAPFPLPLSGSLGSVGYKDRPMFDDKLTTETEFKFDGVNHGTAWKTKVERYMVYKAPILKELLEWAEAQDNEAITEDHVIAACSRKLSEEH